MRNNTDEPLVANVSQSRDGDRFGDLESAVVQSGETRTVGDGTELGWIPREARDHDLTIVVATSGEVVDEFTTTVTVDPPEQGVRVDAVTAAAPALGQGDSVEVAVELTNIGATGADIAVELDVAPATGLAPMFHRALVGWGRLRR